ncbi:MAG: hypothetical protein FGM61_05165 [Sediminibacterium sp.]|nr:hypothetical protein [Sediminibacterium sp.]
MKQKHIPDDFEQFLQDEVKTHRMYPSDQVWNNIRTEIHGKQSWPALTFISLFIISALTVSTFLNRTPHSHSYSPLPANAQDPVVRIASPETVVVTPDEKNNHYLKSIAPEQFTMETITVLQQHSGIQEFEKMQPVTINNTSLTTEHLIAISAPTISPLKLEASVTGAATNYANAPVTSESLLYDPSTVSKDEENPTSAAALNQLAETKGNRQQSADEFLKDFQFVGNMPVLHKSSRIGFQVYATPSISFRQLTDTKLKEIVQSTAANSSNGANLPLTGNVNAGVNEVVRHRPALGLEFGFAVLYKVSNRFQLTTGLQLNLRRYDIETFETRTRDLSSLSLVNTRGVETIQFYSPYNNNTGYRATTLHNDLYQIAAPVGIQWKMLNGKKWGVTAEASVQPTFTIQANTWLISSDYKHYTNGNDLLRKWNVNTGAGIQLNYQSRNAIISVGPQVRYQHLPTYSNLYPVKENLIDYGIRLSITRPN